MDQKTSSEAEVITVDVHAAKNLLNLGHHYLDVRTVEEFEDGHVEKAINIPYMFNAPQGRVKNPKFVEQVLSAFSKEDHLVVGCRSGVRSEYATADLLKADFKHVCNMGGGHIAWVENGFEVTKPKLDKKMSLEAEVLTVDVHRAKDLLNSGHHYLDVRTKEEFEDGHVEKAVNIPYMFSTPKGKAKNPKFIEQVLSAFSKGDHLVVGCQCGVRSEEATVGLLKTGFKHVYNMGGGHIAWEENGFEVKKPNVDL